MISKYTHKGITWIDLEAPLEEEMNHIIDLYPTSEFIKKAILVKPTEDMICLEYEYIYASIQLPSSQSLGASNRITFVASDELVLSIHDEKILGLNNFCKEMESDIIANDKSKISDNKLLLAHLLKNLYVNSKIQLAESEYTVLNLKRQARKNRKKFRNLIIFATLLLILLIISICL